MKKKHPITFYILCSCQFWWALSFYSLWAILPVFLGEELGIDQKTSFATFGAFAALGAAMLFVGGWLADKILGAKRTLVWGFFFQGLGYFIIAYSAITAQPHFVFVGLGTVAVGRGIGSVAPPTIIASAYEKNDPRLDGAYTLFYMVNNIGAFVAQLGAPIMAYSIGWTSAFILSGVGMAVNVITYLMLNKKITKATEADKHAIPFKTNSLFLSAALIAVALASYLLTNLPLAQFVLATAALVILFLITKEMKKEAPISRKRMIVGLVLMGQALAFFVLYNQMPTSLNFFAINNVEAEIFGFAINPVSYQSFNPLWIIFLSPVLAHIYTTLGEKGKDLSMPGKFALGMLVCAAAFGLAGFSQYFGDENGMLNPFWIAAPHFLFAIGELLISALGLSAIAKLFPSRIRGFIYGAWNMTLALASVAGAWVAGLSATGEAEMTPVESLVSYGNYFYALAIASTLVGLVCVYLAPRLNRLIETDVSEETEAKDAQTA
ncbi:MFS transporter [Photobacterium gaetbulicola]|uniref:Putative PTR2 family transport protein n=1 Tax=Photobacterium gaetbulicola Gung47 TaxID=658445 RepID=A0A0C5WGR8_9GAMM|nr:oligopeptide:H+ symporter [Photobacterium gaetbulicola]AJR06303.1 putative PTR2 family transport protein [Photobacterium gaetbulicola Gung47]PSU08755.1 MFS transporter [Photobacterium gaetbulicola]